MFILPRDTVMTPELLQKYIKKHQEEELPRLQRLRNLYEGKHEIFDKEAKAQYKPDNRLVANFAKYIVDTFNGFFIGVPIKVSHEDVKVNEYLQVLDAYNNQDDNNAELSKLCSIFGKGYELLFTDETANVGITYVSPEEAFVIYDDSILRKPLFGVRYYTNTQKKIEGSFSDASQIIYFSQVNNYAFLKENTQQHFFGGVPLIEYVENEEGLGTFEPVETLINAFNNALSEKANDVEYYADAYLKVLGAELDEKSLRTLRDSRIINLEGADADKVIVEFLQKPEADGTQENLISRLEDLIFHLSMVANINDESFGETSGVALKYKLQSMSNLAKTKERKFTAGLNQRYRLISNLPTTAMDGDDWMKIQYQFTRNIPSNLMEESQIAGNLSGVVSQETQLKVLSCVEDVQKEIEKLDEEGAAAAEIFERVAQSEATENGSGEQ